MRAQNLKSYGCQALAAFVFSIFCACLMLALSACSGSGAQLKIVTPYGVYDTTTTGTTVLDTRPMFGAMPPPAPLTVRMLEK